MAIDERITTASDDDWGTEYLDKMISLKVVSSIDEAIAHINTYNTGHSESIITENYRNALKFQDEIDAAAVYVNASTRFTDGFEFGFGAEIGISTQKLHARGPMGLDALTTTKYIISEMVRFDKMKRNTCIICKTMYTYASISFMYRKTLLW